MTFTRLVMPDVNSIFGVITSPFSSLPGVISKTARKLAIAIHTVPSAKWRPGQMLNALEPITSQNDQLKTHRRPKPKALRRNDSPLPSGLGKYLSGKNVCGE